MVESRAYAVIDRAAETLEQLSRELRALSNRASSNGVSATESEEWRAHYDDREIIMRLRRFWDGVTLEPKLPVGAYEIDLSTRVGRWELLVLAVLRAARVREYVVTSTFAALKGEGVLQGDGLIADTPRNREKALKVMKSFYKALAHKAAKVEALFDNYARLESMWAGDLNNVYAAAAGDASTIIGHLTEFKQIGKMAYWICRTLKAHGVWPEPGREATRYDDRPVYLPLRRLGLITDFDRMCNSQHMERILTELDGDVLPLYFQGQTLCSQNNVDVCLAECPVASWCTFPRTDRGDGSGGLP